MSKILYNIKKVILRPIDEETGLAVADGKPIVCTTAEEAKLKSVVSKGSEKVLRTEDKILATATQPDLIYGYDLEFADNKFDILFLQLVEGGTITYDEVDKQKIIGYDSPMIDDGAISKPFITEIYVEQRQGSCVVGYVGVILNYCTGTAPDFEFKKGEFYSPKFNINARENTIANKPVKSLVFLKKLP